MKPLHYLPSASLVCAILLALAASPVVARSVPGNLGNGLDKLVESNLVMKGVMAPSPGDSSVQPNGSTIVGGRTIHTFDGYATPQAASFAKAAMVNAVTKCFMVDVVLG